jgi:hypothetical protein
MSVSITSEQCIPVLFGEPEHLLQLHRVQEIRRMGGNKDLTPPVGHSREILRQVHEETSGRADSRVLPHTTVGGVTDHTTTLDTRTS